MRNLEDDPNYASETGSDRPGYTLDMSQIKKNKQKKIKKYRRFFKAM